jgi:hypothetical protein
VPIISNERQDREKVLIDRDALPKEKKLTPKEINPATGSEKLEPKDINPAMGSYNKIAKADSFEHKLFLDMKPIVEKHHLKGEKFDVFNIVHYRRKNYGRGYLYWIKI